MTRFGNAVRLLRRRWPVVVITLALAMAAGLAVNELASPAYRARTSVRLVPDKSADNPSGPAVSYARAYSRVAVSPAVLGRALSDMSIPMKPEDARHHVRIRVEASPNAPTLEITATAANPNLAANLANAVARGLGGYGRAHVRETGYRIQRLTAAIPPNEPSFPNRPLNLALGGVLGLLLGSLAALRVRPRELVVGGEDGVRITDHPAAARRLPLGRFENGSSEPDARERGGGEVAAALTTILSADRPVAKVSDEPPRLAEPHPRVTPSQGPTSADTLASSRLVGERMPTAVAGFLEGRDASALSGAVQTPGVTERTPLIALTPESVADYVRLTSMIERLTSMIERVNKTLEGQWLSLYNHSLPQAEAEEFAAWFNLDTVAILLDHGDGVFKVAGAVGLTKPDWRKSVRRADDVIWQVLMAGPQVITDDHWVRLASAGMPGDASGAGLITVPLGPPEARFGVVVARLPHRNGEAPSLTAREVETIEAFGRTMALSLQVWIELRRLKSELQRVT